MFLCALCCGNEIECTKGGSGLGAALRAVSSDNGLACEVVVLACWVGVGLGGDLVVVVVEKCLDCREDIGVCFGAIGVSGEREVTRDRDTKSPPGVRPGGWEKQGLIGRPTSWQSPGVRGFGHRNNRRNTFQGPDRRPNRSPPMSKTT